MIRLRAEKISRNFGSTIALKDVNFELEAGEVYALIGPNGAGKSTLSRIISGDITMSSGKIYIDGQETQIKNCHEARAKGICMIYQELRLMPELTVAENIFLNHYQKKGVFIDWKELNNQAEELLKLWNIDMDITKLVKNLSIAKQQLVEILRCLSFNPRVLIMDEPTSSLGHDEVKALFKMIDFLRKKDVSIIYISHILDEVFEISDRITVLKDGEIAGVFTPEKANAQKIVELFINKKEEISENKKVRHTGGVNKKVVLELRDVHDHHVLQGINLQLHQGEILGITGLLGAGKTELGKAIFGMNPLAKGDLFIDGVKAEIRNVKSAIAKGLAMVPEDRRNEGIFPLMNLSHNATINVLKRLRKGLLLQSKGEHDTFQNCVEQLQVKYSSSYQLISELSGGNQQKMVLGKWLATNPKILIADEPTRGIDLGTRKEIVSLIKAIASRGVSVIYISDDIDEIIDVSDRIAVMNDGLIIHSFNADEVDKKTLIAGATGIDRVVS